MTRCHVLVLVLGHRHLTDATSSAQQSTKQKGISFILLKSQNLCVLAPSEHTLICKCTPIYTIAPCLDSILCPLWLWDMNGLASHHKSPKYEESTDWMKRKRRISQPQTKRQLVQDPSFTDPIAHQGSNAQAGRNWCSLKVLALTASIFGHVAN
jgi:hypothetical protein